MKRYDECKYECEVFWVFKDGSKKRLGKIVVKSINEEYAKEKALRVLDEISKYFPIAEPENLSHYDAVCRCLN